MYLPLDQWWFWLFVLLASPFILSAILTAIAAILMAVIYPFAVIEEWIKQRGKEQ